MPKVRISTSMTQKAIIRGIAASQRHWKVSRNLYPERGKTMVNTVRNYDNSYSYQRLERLKQRRNIIIWQRIMGSILVMLSIFIPFLLSDQDGNGAIALIALIISVVLFTQTGGCEHK